MKRRHTLSFQLGTIIVGILIVMLTISSVATYKTAYDKLYVAAGVEAYGCANITTGLIDSKDIEKALAGDAATIEKVNGELNWTIEHKDIFETQYIVDLNGKLIALDSNLAAKGFNAGDQFKMDKDAVDMLLEMKHPTYSKPYEFGGMKRLSGYAPIYKDHDPSKEIIAISVIDFDSKIVSDRTWEVVRDGIFISIIPMLLAAIVTVILLRRKTKPISSLIVQAKEIAQGNLAVKDVEVKSHDEVGDLANTLNTMASNLRSMISTMKDSSSQLMENVSSTTQTLNEMGGAIQMVADHMEEVAADVSDGTRHSDQASSLLTSLSIDLHSSKEKADQLAVNSDQTMGVAKDGEKLALQISNDMEKIRTSSEEVSTTIQDLIESTTKIQNITGSIAGIASQTNLLALNASIEAARAGEHGQGFAVVAEEVRKLAEQSNAEVLEVENLVKDITEKIQQVVLSTKESTILVETGSETAKQTASSLSDITTAVSKTVEEINTISRLMSSEAEKSTSVVQLITDLNTSIKEIEDKTNNVSAATEQTTASIHDVAQQSEHVNEMAKSLEKLVGHFKL